jgi:group I intron endonuclease
MNKIIGIYKITSLSNKVYIGQSIDIFKRFIDYKSLSNCKKQTRLYNSFIFHEVENHSFEIIEECSVEMLNERERYWQDFYDVLNRNKGLNCKLTKTDDKSGKMSDEIKMKLSKKHKGKKISDEVKKNMSEAQKKLYQSGYQHPFKGKKHSEENRRKNSERQKGEKAYWFGKERSIEIRKKISESSKGKKLSEETKRKIGEKSKGRKHTEETKRKMSESKKGEKCVWFGRKHTEESKLKMIKNNSKSIKVINTETGVIYNSISDCQRKTGYKKLVDKLKGKRKNNTPIQYT